MDWNKTPDQMIALPARMVDIADGLCLHVAEGGEGPDMLLLSGWGLGQTIWARSFVHLTQHYHVILPDYPGIGQSTGPWEMDYSLAEMASILYMLLDTLGCEQVVVVGQEWGGLAALLLAYAYPERVSALVLLTPGVVDQFYPKTMRKMTGASPAKIRRMISRHALLPVLRTAFFDQTRITGQLADYLLDPVQSDAAAMALYQMSSTPLPDLSDALMEIRQPVLLMRGGQDVWHPAVSLAPFEQLLPHVTCVEIRNCGYAMPYEKDQPFTQTVMDYLSHHYTLTETRRYATSFLSGLGSLR